MIAAVFGTTGELIKLAPVLARIRARGGSYVGVTTAQQVSQLPPLLDLIGLPQPDVWLARGRAGRDLRTTADIPPWLGRVAVTAARTAPGLRRRLGDGGLVLVHGDTMTTVVGAMLGRALRLPVAHLEAGIRTFDLRHPFPEEANRRIVTRLASIHYAPGEPEAANLGRGRDAVVTPGNTIRDSLALCEPRELPGVEPPFGLVSLHRFELLRDAELLRRTLETLRAASRRLPLLFVDHPVTVAAVDRFGLDRLFGGGLRRIPRLDFFTFVALLRQADFLVTDSGGSQAECWLLDKPCLVHRKVVDHREGLGETTVVSGLRVETLAAFLREPGRHRRRAPLPPESPSDVVVDDLARRGYL
ncbi:MAG TPA: UDP-N-acetylglucosamine 2-epimerase [Gaiellaceae bacterium]|nr:UDP-N-acetylglucosamine 2-epimerase [Gaiellaceae bacterium]